MQAYHPLDSSDELIIAKLVRALIPDVKDVKRQWDSEAAARNIKLTINLAGDNPKLLSVGNRNRLNFIKRATDIWRNKGL